jgi:hypothetical protein
MCGHGSWRAFRFHSGLGRLLAGLTHCVNRFPRQCAQHPGAATHARSMSVSRSPRISILDFGPVVAEVLLSRCARDHETVSGARSVPAVLQCQAPVRRFEPQSRLRACAR